MICAGLAEGHSLLAVCAALGVPHATARLWEQDIPEHAANATRARAMGCHALADEALRIADTPMMGVVIVTRSDGGIEERQEDMTQHRRLQIDTRKWLLSRWLPKVYGDKLAVGGADDLPPIKSARPLAEMSLDEIRAALAKMAAPGGQ
jgi:hypothetical protein